jgi:integrase
MRLGEILGLHRDQVDLRRRLVHLHATKNGESRTVPLSLLATQTFTRALANRRRPGNCPYIFFGTPDREGKNAGPYSFRTAWNVVRTEARLGDLRFHDLRHEAISRFVEDGLSDQEVVAISGHRSMQMLRRYTHLRTEDLVKKLDHVRRRRIRG